MAEGLQSNMVYHGRLHKADDRGYILTYGGPIRYDRKRHSAVPAMSWPQERHGINNLTSSARQHEGVYFGELADPPLYFEAVREANLSAKFRTERKAHGHLLVVEKVTVGSKYYPPLQQ